MGGGGVGGGSVCVCVSDSCVGALELSRSQSPICSCSFIESHQKILLSFFELQYILPSVTLFSTFLNPSLTLGCQRVEEREGEREETREERG